MYGLAKVRTPGPARACARLAAVIIMITACWDGSYPGQPSSRMLVVHGMLVAGAARQEIVVEYSRGINDGYYLGVTPASGAQVSVTGTAAHAFVEDQTRPGIYVGELAAASGQRYTLHIRGPAGETVEGATVVPTPPVLRLPQTDTTVRLGATLTLGWSAVPQAAAYIIIDRAGQPAPPGALAHPALLQDTLVAIQPGKFGGTSFVYRVVAADENYAHYIGGRNISSGVSGAYGVFGSYALSNARVVRVQ